MFTLTCNSLLKTKIFYDIENRDIITPTTKPKNMSVEDTMKQFSTKSPATLEAQEREKLSRGEGQKDADEMMRRFQGVPDIKKVPLADLQVRTTNTGVQRANLDPFSKTNKTGGEPTNPQFRVGQIDGMK